MKAQLFIPMFATALLLFGCTDDTMDSSWNGEIRLSSGIAVQTRADEPKAPDTQIANGQQVGVFINEKVEETTINENAEAATAIAANLKYEANGSGVLTLVTTDPAQETPYYPNTGNSVKIVAYQPYNAGAALTGDGYQFTVKDDQNGNEGKDYYDSDLLYSASKEEGYARQSTPHNLEFRHKLSKIVCSLTSGAGSPTITGATVEIVNPVTSGTFKPSDGTFTTTTTASEGEQTKLVKMNSTITSSSYIAVIPPQTFTKDAQFLKVTLNSDNSNAVYYYKIPNSSQEDKGLELSGGYVYKYNIKVNMTGLTVTSTISDWTAGSENPIQGDAVMGN